MDCMMHGYSERSARAKLQRHRERGDTSVSAIFHEECGQWHVEKFAEIFAGLEDD